MEWPRCCSYLALMAGLVPYDLSPHPGGCPLDSSGRKSHTLLGGLPALATECLQLGGSSEALDTGCLAQGDDAC